MAVEAVSVDEAVHFAGNIEVPGISGSSKKFTIDTTFGGLGTEGGKGAVGATATLGGKELIWRYLDLIFEDLDKKTVSVSDAGVTISGPSRVKQRTLCALLGGSSPLRRVELGPLEVSVPLDEIATGKGDTPARLALTTASCEWLPFPDLLPYDEVYEVLSALMDPHAAELNLVDEADASRGARRRFDRDRRDRRSFLRSREDERRLSLSLFRPSLDPFFGDPSSAATETSSPLGSTGACGFSSSAMVARESTCSTEQGNSARVW